MYQMFLQSNNDIILLLKLSIFDGLKDFLQFTTI